MDTGFENPLLDGGTQDWAESGDRTYTFCAGNESVQSAADGTSYLWNQEGCSPATEEDLRAYFEEALNLQETFGDFETYMAYMNEREDLIASGEYDSGSWGDTVDTGGLTFRDPYGNVIAVDPDDYNNLSPNDFMAKYGLDPSELEVIEADTTGGRRDAYIAWLESEAVQALNEKYGIDDKLVNEDGREYMWNGTGWVKVTEPDNMDFGRILKIVTALAGAAVTGNALGPIIGGAIGGAAGTAVGTGAVKGVIGSLISQVALTGEIDPQALVQAALLGGLNSLAGAAIAGELAGTALDNALWDISGALGISYEEAANILAGMASGAITGEDVTDIVAGAVGGWTESQIMSFLQDTYGDTVTVQDWFKDGASNIPVEALAPIVEQIVGGLIDGSIDDPQAWLETVWNYFQSGGDVDFMLPDGLDIRGFMSQFGDFFDFDICKTPDDGSEKPWYCNIGLPPGVEIPDLCEEWEWLQGICDAKILCIDSGGEWDSSISDCVGSYIPDFGVGDLCEENGEEGVGALDALGNLFCNIDISVGMPCEEGGKTGVYALDSLGELICNIEIECPDWAKDADGSCLPIGNPCEDGEGILGTIAQTDAGEWICSPDITCPDWARDDDGTCLPIGNPCEDEEGAEGFLAQNEVGEWFCDPQLTCPDWARDESGQCLGIGNPCTTADGEPGWIEETGVSGEWVCNPEVDITGCIDKETGQPGKLDDLGNCIPEVKIPNCSGGMLWDGDLQKCVCPEAQEWDEVLEKCVDIEIEGPDIDPPCNAGSWSDIFKACVCDDEGTPENPDGTCPQLPDINCEDFGLTKDPETGECVGEINCEDFGLTKDPETGECIGEINCEDFGLTKDPETGECINLSNPCEEQGGWLNELGVCEFPEIDLGLPSFDSMDVNLTLTDPFEYTTYDTPELPGVRELITARGLLS